MKLREYTNEEIHEIYESVNQMKDWSKVAFSGLYKRSEVNNRMLDAISFQDGKLDNAIKASIINSIEEGKKPTLISINGCHTMFCFYELNGVKFFTNVTL